MLEQIISGGQTGADRTALELAREFGFKAGGFAPKGYKTENGPDMTLKTIFGLGEARYADYPYRTKLNVQMADLTVIYGNINSRGSQCTIKCCYESIKHYMVNPSPTDLIDAVEACQVKILNVAGNRLSRNKNIVKIVQDGLRPVLMHFAALCLACGYSEDAHPVSRTSVSDNLDEILICGQFVNRLSPSENRSL